MKSAFRFGAFELRPADRLLLHAGRELAIGGRAFDVLCVLVTRQPQVVSMLELLETVWPRAAVEPNNVQVQIWALRKLLGARAIVTVPRRGYRFMPHRVGYAQASGDAPALLPSTSDGHPHDWLGLLSGRRLLTLVADPPTRLRRWMEVVARGMAEHTGGLVWTLDAGAPSSAAAALGQRLRSRSDVVVLAPDARPSDHLRGKVDALLDQAPAIRCVAAAPAALGHPEEVARPLQGEFAGAQRPISLNVAPLLRSRPRQR